MVIMIIISCTIVELLSLKGCVFITVKVTHLTMGLHPVFKASLVIKIHVGDYCDVKTRVSVVRKDYSLVFGRKMFLILYYLYFLFFTIFYY